MPKFSPKERQRRNEAKAAAESYAPAPRDSYLLYGIIGLALAAVALVAFNGFYGVDLLQFPVSVVLFLGVAAAAGVVLRLVRRTRHKTAVKREYHERAPNASIED